MVNMGFIPGKPLLKKNLPSPLLSQSPTLCNLSRLLLPFSSIPSKLSQKNLSPPFLRFPLSSLKKISLPRPPAAPLLLSPQTLSAAQEQLTHHHLWLPASFCCPRNGSFSSAAFLHFPSPI